MPLHIFRAKSKTIYWIVAIIVIPSFIFLWGSGGSNMNQRGSGPVVAHIDGKDIRQMDFYKFRERILTVVGGRGIMMRDFPYDKDNLITLTLIKSYINHAEEAGLKVSDKEIGTFIRQNRFFLDDGKFSKKHYNSFLTNRRMSHKEYLTAVREWLLAKKFIETFDGTTQCTDSDAYTHYAMGKTKYTYRKIPVKAEAFEDAAQAELSKVEGEDKESDAAFEARIEQFLAENKNDKQFWTAPKWRLEIIFAPFDVPALKPEITEDEVGEYYRRYSQRYNGKKLEEVRGEILAELLEQKQKDIAGRTILDAVEKFVTKRIENNTPVTLGDVLKDALLAKRGIKTGVSSEKPLTPQEINKLPMVASSPALMAFLNKIDNLKDEKKAKRVKALKENFDTSNPPLISDSGAFRVRILDYIPGEPKALRDKDGKLDRELRLKIASILVKQRSNEMARERAEQAAREITEKKEELTVGEMVTQPLAQVPAKLRYATIDQPVIVPSATGFDVLILKRREVPSKEMFEAAGEKERDNAILFSRRRLAGSVYSMPGWLTMINPGVRLRLWNINALQSGRVKPMFKTEEDEDKKKS